MQNVLKKLVLAFLIAIPSMVWAQSSCDKLFSEGSKLQQTMTINAQYKAIKMFEKAKICYDSKERKNICDQQIKTCRTIIYNLQQSEKESEEPSQQTQETKPTKTTAPQQQVKNERKDVVLVIEESQLKFKAAGGEFKKVKVRCNYDDWEVCEKPEWVMYSRNSENELVIEVTENDSEEERAGVVRIKCGNVEKSLVINQKKYNKLQRLRKKVNI